MLRNRTGDDVVLRAAWLAGGYLRRRDAEDGVLVAGSPRSGTSWLLDLLELDRDVRRLWEPLFVEERLTAAWALDLRIPFDHGLREERVLVVTYEELVRDLGATLDRIAAFADLDLSVERAREVERRPSEMTVADSNVRTDGDRLATWRRRLSPDQAGRILAVAYRFGIAAYGEALEPDRSRLARAAAGLYNPG